MEILTLYTVLLMTYHIGLAFSKSHDPYGLSSSTVSIVLIFFLSDHSLFFLCGHVY